MYLLSRAESLMSLVSRVRMVAAGISSQNTPSILHTACEERRKKTQYSHREDDEVSCKYLDCHASDHRDIVGEQRFELVELLLKQLVCLTLCTVRVLKRKRIRQQHRRIAAHCIPLQFIW